MYFKNNSFRFVKTNLLLTDITNPEEQKEKLLYHHQGKTCHKEINEMNVT